MTVEVALHDEKFSSSHTFNPRRVIRKFCHLKLLSKWLSSFEKKLHITVKNPTKRHRCQHEQISQPCIQTKNGGFHDPKSNIDNILMKYRKKKYRKNKYNCKKLCSTGSLVIITLNCKNFSLLLLFLLIYMVVQVFFVLSTL